MIVVICLLKYHKHTNKKVASKENSPWVCELLYACPYAEKEVHTPVCYQ